MTTESQVSKNEYPFAIVGDKAGHVRALCQTRADAEDFARKLVAANGGTAVVVDRSAVAK